MSALPPTVHSSSSRQPAVISLSSRQRVHFNFRRSFILLAQKNNASGTVQPRGLASGALVTIRLPDNMSGNIIDAKSIRRER
jgi:hypothetical protein